MHYLRKNLSVIIIVFIISTLVITISFLHSDEIYSLMARGQHPSLQMKTFEPPTSAPTLTSTPVPTRAPTATNAPAPNSNPGGNNNPGSSGGTAPAIDPNTSQSNPTTPVVASSCSDQEIQKLVDSVSEQNLRTNLENIAGGNVSRYVGQPGNQQKAEVIKQYMESVGLASSFQQFQGNGQALNNVIGDLPGQNTNEYFVVSAHIDSISGPKTPAPGADDNGSGTVVFMEAARVLKGFSQCMKTSVQFVGFNAEEVGLLGSRHYVQNLGGKTVKGNFNIDMVGNSTGTDCVDHNYVGGTNSETISNKMLEVIKKYNIGLQGKTNQFSAPSDNKSFSNKGLPAVSLHECVHNQKLHTLDDTTQNITYSQITKTTKAIVAAVAELGSK